MIGGDMFFNALRARAIPLAVTGCVSALPRAHARGRADTQPVTANGIARARSALKKHITTNHIALPIIQLANIIIPNFLSCYC